MADRIAFPNGMAVTPDNATLIVADSYQLAGTGQLLMAEAPAPRPAGPRPRGQW